MKITHTVDISDYAPPCFSGDTDLELEVDLRVTSWEQDEYRNWIIDDMEFDQISFYNEDGALTTARGSLEQAIMLALDKDPDFTTKIYSTADEQRAARALEQALYSRGYNGKEDL